MKEFQINNVILHRYFECKYISEAVNIGIVGQGFVGSALKSKFENFFNVLTYDLKPGISNSSIEEIVNNCNIIFVCVPTPMNEDGSCNIMSVDTVLKSLNKTSKKNIVVIKSTIPPGSTEKLNSNYKRIKVVFNPEFLREKHANEDFDNVDRIILGGDRDSLNKLTDFYSKIFPKANIVRTSSNSAEMMKYFTNAYLAMKVVFCNEIFQICEKNNIEYDEVIKCVGFDKRIGQTHFSVPGPDGDFGFGGHCFPKDVNALIKIAENLNSNNILLKSIIQSNNKVRTNKDWEQMKGRAIN